MALLLAKQGLTQQAKEARDLKAKELEEEVEARTAKEGSAQSTRNSPTRSSSPMSPAQWAAGLQNVLGEVKESFNLWLEQYGVQAHQFLPQQQLVQTRLLAHRKAGQLCLWKERRAVWRRYRLVVRRKTTVGDFFRPESRFQPY